MTVQFGSQVYIGWVDIAGCGAAIVNSIDAPATPLELPCLANAPAAFSVVSHDTLNPCIVKHVTTAGGQVSFISINAEPTADIPAITIAHELVTFLRGSAVEFVGVLGAAHLSSAAAGELYCSKSFTSGGTAAAAMPDILKSAHPLPEGTELKDEMLASLYCWLQASGMPSVLCLVRGHRAASSQPSACIDSVSFGDLLGMPTAITGVSINMDQLHRSKVLTAGPAQAMKVDSLMYM